MTFQNVIQFRKYLSALVNSSEKRWDLHLGNFIDLKNNSISNGTLDFERKNTTFVSLKKEAGQKLVVSWVFPSFYLSMSYDSYG